MGEVRIEFERDLARWRVRYQGRPRHELLRLLLLGLEREELVSIGYRDAVLEGRLQRMPIPEGVRDVVRQALLWTWKDEEMHAIYVRGALLKLGSPRLRLQALARQLAGAIGGWSSSILQHVPWSQAPLSRLLARGFSLAGLLTGRVSSSIWARLDVQPFREFCLFNVDAERTAAACWERATELSRSFGGIPHATIEELRRMQVDETNHTRLFELLAASFDDQDRLVAGVDENTLAARIREVGVHFVSRARRPDPPSENPLGTGGEVWVAEGRDSGAKLPLFRRLLADAGLPEVLRERAARVRKGIADLRVAVKASFMMGYHRKDLSPIVDPALLRALVLELHALGARDVAVVESRNIYDRFYARRSVPEVAAYFGMDLAPARIADLSEEQVEHHFARGMAQATVGRSWKQADLRISFGKLRSHPVDQVHLSVANLEAMGARCDEFIFTERQAHRDAAIMTLISDFPPHFALLEGFDAAPDGLLGVMGCPRPRSPRRLYAGRDAIAVDCVAARHLGVADPKRSGVLRMAFHWFGDPRERTVVRGVDEPVRPWRGPQQGEWSSLLSLVAFPIYSVASGRGSLFVPEMDEAAFPPATPPRAGLALARGALRTLLGLRHAR